MSDLFSVADVTAARGTLRKMGIAPGEGEAPAHYTLRTGEQRLALNAHLGAALRLTHTGNIHCLHCGRRTRKSFAQGYCYPCFKSLAQCDTCIVKPETCHYHLGTCREPRWGEQHCFQPHVVYLANSSGLKVGITRKTQLPTRWLDQGAIQALPILEVDDRLQSGLVETLFKQVVGDRTNWRAMLKGDVAPLDLVAERDRLLASLAPELAALRQRVGETAIREVSLDPLSLSYPVWEAPRKVVSHNFDKDPDVSGRLMGLKGQYLILDTGVINLRKFGGYEVDVAIE
ncbi:uncharacterized protein DUF2797 [Chromohalobacter marismortui]|uniref:Uncharacterized protein DUF2797 n=1 Tax=Chromohalobacter marismortui TaxID=42055 RepID=A0A4R7NVM9_9GAMM|nr:MULTISPECIES: DUF2797 domain-containing protein [Chromohalobacter]MCI0510601.1 DUF2797 domain-containing protein [Chromohalobacter sp.]MCI0591916.1 DUF2797 domain-containing protein [Chromohalobacter sp.]TDU24822.1 uncharacterized protein DUF2797 [Chromohalobacter marismortui]